MFWMLQAIWKIILKQGRLLIFYGRRSEIGLSSKGEMLLALVQQENKHDRLLAKKEVTT